MKSPKNKRKQMKEGYRLTTSKKLLKKNSYRRAQDPYKLRSCIIIKYQLYINTMNRVQQYLIFEWEVLKLIELFTIWVGKCMTTLKNRVFVTNSIPYISATQCRRPLIFQTMHFVISNSLSLKFQKLQLLVA